ncbi:MAG: carbohydrate kinase [Gemmatimonadetes bacterium]|nr:carbohydrate kinase [Gemmatimonadota bacterium]MYH20392.1 carbohydrate kinase [Gemmatimonadota bacterium]MYK98728.1 carbohydrate kinase [Gemmatimonadota bacterium]
MTPHRLESLLSRFAGLSVMVVGDFFLDKYLVLDPALDEPSLETGLAARQVVARRCMPGAAGTVVANLHALGVGDLLAVGVTGDDGEGYELRQGLAAMGIRLDGLFESTDRFTPTYIKPMNREPGGEKELSRIDIQNRTPTPRSLEDRLIEFMEDMMPVVDGVAVLDQVGRRNTGVVTDRVRDAICRLGRDQPDKVILADSRERIGNFRHVIRKGNRDEMRGVAEETAQPGEMGGADKKSGLGKTRGAVDEAARPVFVTLGADGLLLIDGEDRRHVPGIRVPGPVDTVGAGDSVTAGIVASLAAGATPMEAGLVGNLAASVTVRQLGVTGTASPAQLVEALKTLMEA